ncbi:MAG TPA: hypothetical protein VF595_00695 [Tepidisphaeraceae bacterium]
MEVPKKRCVLHQCVLLIIAFSSVQVVAAPPTTEPDWKALYLDEAPRQWEKLIDSLGTLNVICHNTYSQSQVKDKVSYERKISSTITSTYAINLGCMKLESLCTSDSLFPNSKPVTNFIGITPKYRFEATRREDKPYSITQFNKLQSEPIGVVLRRQLEESDVACAATLNGKWISELFGSKQAELKSATSIESEGKRVIRLDLEMRYPSTSRPYPATVIVDPDLHWAVLSYEMKYPAGTRKGKAEYQDIGLGVAFPKKFTYTFDGVTGARVITSEMIFEKPQQVSPAATEFVLEAFDLEEPQSGVVPGPTTPGTTPSTTKPAPQGPISTGSGVEGSITADDVPTSPPAVAAPSVAGDDLGTWVLTRSRLLAFAFLFVGIVSYIVYLLSLRRPAVR